MRVIHDRYQAGETAKTRLILLPPAKATVEDFFLQGFIARVREQQLPIDITLAEVGYQQVMAGTVADDLHQQVVTPAREEGCQHIWMAGISLGAFNALYYAAHFSTHLQGMYLMAPYPGTTDILNEISQAGGVSDWAVNHKDSQADERIWWHWLWQHSIAQPKLCSIYLALAEQDRFADGQIMLSRLISPEHIHRQQGDHSWLVWQQMWQHWLEDGPLSRKTPV